MKTITKTLVFLLLSPYIVHAAPITFDLFGPGLNVIPADQPLTVTSMGQSLDAFGFVHANGTASDDAPFAMPLPRRLNRNSRGLGVLLNSDSGELDGSGPDEFIVLDFSSFLNPVKLLSVVFDSVNDNDEFDMAVDDVDIDIDALLGNDSLATLPLLIGGTSQQRIADFSSFNLEGALFSFYTANTNDDYRLRSITVQETPEPATLLLIFSGLGGMYCARRREEVSLCD